MQTLNILLTTVLVVLTTSPISEALKKDIKVEYFAATSLTCRLDDMPPVPVLDRLFWITNDAVILDSRTTTMPKNLEWGSADRETLNITKVDDEQFGYFTCVMVPSGISAQPIITRWGVNINGADYSKLEEQYRESAVIGAIAAAVMLVLVGGSCIIWHFRYSKRAASKGNGSSIEDDDPKAGMNYQNQAFDHMDGTEMTEAVATTPDDKLNGTTTTNTGGPENGGYESYRM